MRNLYSLPFVILHDIDDCIVKRFIDGNIVVIFNSICFKSALDNYHIISQCGREFYIQTNSVEQFDVQPLNNKVCEQCISCDPMTVSHYHENCPGVNVSLHLKSGVELKMKHMLIDHATNDNTIITCHVTIINIIHHESTQLYYSLWLKESFERSMLIDLFKTILSAQKSIDSKNTQSFEMRTTIAVLEDNERLMLTQKYDSYFKCLEVFNRVRESD